VKRRQLDARLSIVHRNCTATLGKTPASATRFVRINQDRVVAFYVRRTFVRIYARIREMFLFTKLHHERTLQSAATACSSSLSRVEIAKLRAGVMSLRVLEISYPFHQPFIHHARSQGNILSSVVIERERTRAFAREMTRTIVHGSADASEAFPE